MKIEIWSDFVCPFCYIGKRRFEQGLNNFEHKDEVEIVFKSFELMPHFGKDLGKSIHQVISDEKGIPIEQAKSMHAQLTAQANELGLDYQFDTMIPTNTLNAHRMTHFAAKSGKMVEMSERIFKAYFVESKHIGDFDTLASLAEEVGLDREQALQMLNSDQFTAEVKADEQEAANIGVQGVPFFVINRKYAVSGAQPPHVFTEVLNQVWEETKAESPLIMKSDGSNTCTDESCDI
ncbi:DsbA family oxidoreductase [Paenibacillus turicensis]|uniref:DsbA family oxidoreductase n=1 Tax=Paenibacillus turicensis TaxID=160487 RepID=UPI003D2B22F0